MTEENTTANDGTGEDLSGRMKTYLAEKAEPWVTTEVSRLRHEAAGHRDRAHDAEREVERLAEQVSDLDAALRRALVAAAGLPVEVAERLRGSTAEELSADAAWWATNLRAGGGNR